MQAQNKIRTRAVVGRTLKPLGTNNPGTHEFPGIVEGRYEARLARNAREIASALRLRHTVFNVEIGNKIWSPSGAGLEFDKYDFKCRHLIVIDRYTDVTVGTYRLNSIETARTTSGFYSANEFSIEDLPGDVLRNGIEIGRACIAKEHRNTKVLYLLWKALLAYLNHADKQYFFGCCSIFTGDAEIGSKAYGQLQRDGHIHDRFRVKPRRDGITTPSDTGEPVELPSLFKMYLKLGARVCGPPMIDRGFGSIDFFVVFDVSQMSPKYQRIFGA